MAEWEISKHEQRKKAREAQKPAWEKEADRAWERSGARFMMELDEAKRNPKPKLTMVVLCGLPGSGKSLLAAALKRQGFATVCQDDLGSRQKCEARARDVLKKGRRVCIDRCNHTDQQRELWLELNAENAPAESPMTRQPPIALVVHLVADAALAKKRVLGRKGHQTLPAVPESKGIVDRFAREFEPPTQQRCWRVDRRWVPNHLAAAIMHNGHTADTLPPPPPPPLEKGKTPVERLSEMGWAPRLCEAALLNAGGDEDHAIDLLLTRSAEELLGL